MLGWTPEMSLKVKFHEKWSSWSFNNLAILCVAIFLIGATFRLSQYIADRSLWLDEAKLALNIINRSFSGLAQPLDYDQGAPLGFLFVQKLLTVLLGNADYVLRIFPLICGLFSFWAIYALSNEYSSNVRLLSQQSYCLLSQTDLSITHRRRSEEH